MNIERVKQIFDKFGNSFLYKNFHILEIKQFEKLNANDKIAYLARRFAAKEAMAKAIGKGIGNGIAFKDIAVINDRYGAPKIIISPDIYPDLKGKDIHVSLSDDYPFAVAFITISN